MRRVKRFGCVMLAAANVAANLKQRWGEGDGDLVRFSNSTRLTFPWIMTLWYFFFYFDGDSHARPAQTASVDVLVLTLLYCPILVLQWFQNPGLCEGIYSPISCWLRLWMRVCSGKSRTPSHGDRLSPFPETLRAICQHKTRNHCKTATEWQRDTW